MRWVCFGGNAGSPGVASSGVLFALHTTYPLRMPMLYSAICIAAHAQRIACERSLLVGTVFS